MSDATKPSRKPDLLLKVRLRPTQDDPTPFGHVVGAGWINADGSVSLTLRPGTSLKWNDGLQMTLFPDDGEAKFGARKGKAKS